ncbi:MAG: penicillin-binding protein beta-lactamase class [Ferruginibacter sp.]|nr:penicillin-binding protein beta-lactamase class [Ferruginibacter sp.]
MLRILFLFLVIGSLLSCKKTSEEVALPPGPESYYYPPLTGEEWLTKTATGLNWDETKLQEAFDYAGSKNSFGVVLLQHGKIVKEQYWNGWTKDTKYYIASAGKSVAGFLTGIAQQEGTLNINNKVSQYLGTGWTSLSLAKENLITVKNQLTMTTGLDDAVADPDCINPSCLLYKADAGTRWAYHNAPYHLLQDVIANASGKTFNQYSKEKLFDKIGMPNAFWYNHIMWCTTREAARFGSMIISGGKWNGVSLSSDAGYFNAMLNSSQTINNSYGYLWWLNGKQNFMLPQSQLVFPGSLCTNAPADMYMALGKDDKKIYIVPSLDVVLVRLGDSAGTTTAGPSSFDNELWGKLKLALKY